MALLSGKSIVLAEKLGEGGQGQVWRAHGEDGEEYAFKWYHRKAIKDPEKFYGNLERNVKSAAPSDKFLWPLDLTARRGGRFGYVMRLKPAGFRSFSEFLCARARFASLGAAVNAALEITNAFRDLHRKGYSYQDLNDGNFFIDPENGEVLICDNDNVAPYGVSLGIAGKARYMAPEVARRKGLPDNYSDRFSLAVVLFELLFLNHPLEGRKTLVPCMTEELELKFYAKEPVFIFDPSDASNRPDPAVHVNASKLWGAYPDFLREKFMRSFCADALGLDGMEKARSARLMDSEWQTAFVDLRCCLAECACGQELIIDPDHGAKCRHCGREISRPMSLSVGKYRVVMFPGVELRRCHVDSFSDDYSTVKGDVTRHPEKPSLWGLRNLDDKNWTVTLDDGTECELRPGRSMRIGEISSVAFDSSTRGMMRK